MIHIDITADGTATLRENGRSEKITQDSADQAQEAVIATLISRAQAEQVTLRAITSDQPPTMLDIHPSGTVSVIDQDHPPKPEPSEPTNAADKDAGPEVETVTQQPSIPDPVEHEPAEPASTPPPAAPQEKVNQLTGETPHPGSRRAARTRRESRESFLTPQQIEEPAAQGWRGLLSTLGMRIKPGAKERSERDDRQAVSQHWPGPRTIAIVNGKGGANKTPTTVCLSAVFARSGGGGILAWDNNQTRGTLPWRTEKGPHDSTILDLLDRTDSLLATGAQSADLARFVHHQTGDRYDVLRSKPKELADRQRFHEDDVDAIHAVASKFYRLVFIDSGNDESDPMWLRMIEHTDQLVVATTTEDDKAESAALLLETLEAGSEDSAALADNAVVVVSQSNSTAPKASVERIRKGFEPLARSAVSIPYDPAMVRGMLTFTALNNSTQRAWLHAAAEVARGIGHR